MIKLSNLTKQEDEPDVGTVQNVYFSHRTGSGGQSSQLEKVSTLLRYQYQNACQKSFLLQYSFNRFWDTLLNLNKSLLPDIPAQPAPVKLCYIEFLIDGTSTERQ